MQFRASLKYQLYGQLKAIGIFYLVILLLSCMIVIQVQAFQFRANINGLDVISSVFLFILGLNVFKEPFLFFLQNGVDRRTIFLANMSSAVLSALTMAVVGGGIQALSRLTEMDDYLFSYELIEIYTGMEGANWWSLLLGRFCLNMALGLFCVLLGQWISSSYYRMGKKAKIAVSVGVPAFFAFGFPLLDFYIFQEGLSSFLLRSFLSLMGISSGNPYVGVFWMLFLAGVLSVFCWLLIWKAPVKKR